MMNRWNNGATRWCVFFVVTMMPLAGVHATSNISDFEEGLEDLFHQNGVPFDLDMEVTHYSDETPGGEQVTLRAFIAILEDARARWGYGPPEDGDEASLGPVDESSIIVPPGAAGRLYIHETTGDPDACPGASDTLLVQQGGVGAAAKPLDPTVPGSDVQTGVQSLAFSSTGAQTSRVSMHGIGDVAVYGLPGVTDRPPVGAEYVPVFDYNNKVATYGGNFEYHCVSGDLQLTTNYVWTNGGLLLQ